MDIRVKHFSELSARELHDIYKLRVAVFVVEQNCPYQEVDGRDIDAHHVCLYDGEELVAYLRVLAPGAMFSEAALGRVISARRRQGLGSVVMREGIAAVRRLYGEVPIKIEAQSYAQPFYSTFGFKTVSAEFLEDGIPHVEMILEP